MVKSQELGTIHQVCTIAAGLLIVFGLYFALGNEEFISWVSNAVGHEIDKLPSFAATSSAR